MNNLLYVKVNIQNVYVWHCYIILIVYNVIFNFLFSEHKVNVSVLIDILCNLLFICC